MGGKQRGYKRSWRNLLLSKQYQLSFTLTMVGLAAVIMIALGWWVQGESERKTKIFLNNINNRDCTVMPAAADTEPERPRAAVSTDIGEMKMVTPEDDKPDGEEKKPDGAENKKPDGAEGKKPEQAEAPVAPDEAGGAADRVAAPIEPDPSAGAPAEPVAEPDPDPVIDQECLAKKEARRDEVITGQARILYTLIGVGLLLVFGLAIYGIKMTHRVAGPLFKVTLYFNKMKDGRYDTVYNLRKGDQLMAFYEHFKGAHSGVVDMQKEDIERLKETIAAAEKEGLASKSPEVAAVLEEMKAALDRKEKSLV